MVLTTALEQGRAEMTTSTAVGNGAQKGELDAQGHKPEAESGLEPKCPSPFSRHVVNTYHVPGPVLASGTQG